MACELSGVGPCVMSHQPAPTKLYLPIVSVVAALSKRKESFDLDLFAVGTANVVESVRV